jgi:hypothetical protein
MSESADKRPEIAARVTALAGEHRDVHFRRVLFGRLSEHLRLIGEHARAAVDLLENAITQIDRNRTQPLPTIRWMLLAAIKGDARIGLTRSEIVDAVHRDYGVLLSPATVTTTLSRMLKAGLVVRRGVRWTPETRGK